LRVRAPHRGALLGFPGGLPFFKQPRRFAWGSFAALLCIPTPRPPVDRPDNGLSAGLHSDVLNCYLLLTAAAVRPQALRHRRKRPQQLCSAVDVALHAIVCLLGEHPAPHKLHALAVQAMEAGKRCSACKAKAPRYSGLIFHDLRRTAARNLRRAGIAEGVIMKIGGWKTRSVFERYAIVNRTDIVDAMQRLQQTEKALEAAATVAISHENGHAAQQTEAQARPALMH
jgi:hypothetical protein